MASRRSGRAKPPASAYTNDPFASILSDDESTKKTKAKGRKRKNDDPAFGESTARSTPGPSTNSSTEKLKESKGEEGSPSPSKKNRHLVWKARKDGMIELADTDEHIRGIIDPKDHVSKWMHYILTYGSDVRDMSAVVHQRGRWRWARDATFPTRKTLNMTEGDSDMLLGPTFGVDLADVEREQTSGWDWYDQDVGAKLRNTQHIDTDINPLDARKHYLPRPKKGKHTLITGPVHDQKATTLGHHEYFDFGETWEKNSKGSSATTRLREGWMINIGHRMSCIAWMPHQNGLDQYLAVTAPITDQQKAEYHNSKIDPPTAFSPQPSYPTAIQIWKFQSKETGFQTHDLDIKSNPELRLVVCTDWGDLRHMAWCPNDRAERDVDSNSDTKGLGLLAGIWGDGKLRVLDIKIKTNQNRKKATEFVKITSPVFEGEISSTVCTCLTWVSPSDIAVGCANGYVAVWSIIPSTPRASRPWFYYQIHATYVLEITSAYPAYPHLVSTAGMDGETRLWSMIDTQAESTASVRMRSVSAVLSYSPILQAVCSSDDLEYGRLMPIRRFFATNGTAKCPSTITCIAPCNVWHPTILYGGTGGEVSVTNPFRRNIYNKEQTWQQLWFSHDWAQGSDPDSTGNSRFYEGYAAETGSAARDRLNDSRPTGVTLTTVYDEGTHITALGWNPNRHCAAWASAALGCGLLRVEDLSIKDT
ncbi:hypothetical protein N7495_008098 [Penicillium taxi]|uniref:uncharacterized protein n=1 Tax=Penicillium taxi TaxID=168475 RepID=UPI0025458B94|nr:uncharacterized protein N7495_008098 [Penicillium taxi]KAJ5888057.1 hypothetical protein N7495_008098 [Penicillium taxi]